MSGLAHTFTENDEAIKHLLRQVVYMFYPHQCIVIMEALLFHNVLFEDDLIKLCCMHKKVFRSFCNKLIEDRLIVSHTQKEETQPYKLFTRTYYYVHSIEAIDSVKWKIHTIVKKVKEEIGNFSEPQGYICPTCHTKYTLLDAASLLTDDKLNFECSICNDYLIDDDISQEQKKGQEKLEKLMSLVEPIIQYLKIVDDLKIDDNNFESTLMKYVPAFSDSLAIYAVSNRSSGRRKKFDNTADLNEANKKSQATIHVSITADDEDLKRERQKREDRNRKLRQNALPDWHQESTVGKAALGRLDFEIEENEDDTFQQQYNQSNQFDNNSASHSSANDTSIKQEDSSNVIDIQTNTSTLVDTQADNENKDNSSISVKSELPSDSATNTNSLANVTIAAPDSLSIKSNTSKSSRLALQSSNVPNTPSVNEGTTSEEFDALSAYYSQLRQRQAVEEEEEEAEEEEEEEEEAGEEGEDINMDDDAMAAFNDDDDDDDDNDGNAKTSKSGNSLGQHATAVQPETGNKSNQQTSKANIDDDVKEDIDEDDFDLDMFESDEE